VKAATFVVGGLAFFVLGAALWGVWGLAFFLTGMPGTVEDWAWFLGTPILGGTCVGIGGAMMATGADR
jgi:hypothetical protein